MHLQSLLMPPNNQDLQEQDLNDEVLFLKFRGVAKKAKKPDISKALILSETIWITKLEQDDKDLFEVC